MLTLALDIPINHTGKVRWQLYQQKCRYSLIWVRRWIVVGSVGKTEHCRNIQYWQGKELHCIAVKFSPLYYK